MCYIGTDMLLRKGYGRNYIWRTHQVLQSCFRTGSVPNVGGDADGDGDATSDGGSNFDDDDAGAMPHGDNAEDGIDDGDDGDQHVSINVFQLYKLWNGG